MAFNLRTLINFLAIASAVIAIYLDYNNIHRWFMIFKPLTTILILGIAVVDFRLAPRKFAVLISLGLVFCLWGDIFLLDNSGFIYGLVAFLIGHILFSLAFISIDGLKTSVVPVIVLAIFVVIFYGYVKDGLGDMTLPVMAYILVISFMVWQGISLYLWQKQKAYVLIAVSAVLFMLSDTILAVNLFKVSFPEATIYNLSTYWTSLLLLTNSFKAFKAIE